MNLDQAATLWQLWRELQRAITQESDPLLITSIEEERHRLGWTQGLPTRSEKPPALPGKRDDKEIR